MAHRLTSPWISNSLLLYRVAQAAAMLVAAFLTVVTVRIVPLTPRVDESFFFADDDPQLQEDKKIHKIFPKQDQIIINIEGRIASPRYLSRIERLTQRLLKIPEVQIAKSLTHGPKDFKDALTSEFWGRVLIPEDRKSSNIFIILRPNSGTEAISKIEQAVGESGSADFQPVIAGVSYMIELIQRRLLYDIKVFSLCAVALFGLMILLVFRSLSVLVGCLTTCAAATSLTLLVGHATGLEVGILTANLVALVFVLTIPHTIYFTYNWKRHSADSSDPLSSVQNAFWETLPGSFWSTGTTLLGFLSLLLVQAKPLRQRRDRDDLRPGDGLCHLPGFILSQFPPTRRFGLWVVLGTLLVLPATLFFLPTLASIRHRGKK